MLSKVIQILFLDHREQLNVCNDSHTAVRLTCLHWMGWKGEVEHTLTQQHDQVGGTWALKSGVHWFKISIPH